MIPTLRTRGPLPWALAAAIAHTGGCASDLAPDPVDDDPIVIDDPIPGDGIPPRSGAFEHVVGADGTVATVVDATDAAQWQALDLDTGRSVDDETWDLSFSRFRVRIHGGITGDGGVEVAALAGRAFDAVDAAPADGWTTSWPDGEDNDTEDDNLFNNGTEDWYDYDLSTHTLTPRDVTYVVRSTEGRHYAVRFEGYYDGAGTPGVIAFRWKEVDAPPADDGIPDDALVIDASDRATWVHVRIGEGVVTVNDPTSDTGWDLAFRRTDVRTSSGTSGPGLGGARLDDSGLPFDAISQATTFGYAEDVVVESARPGVPPTSKNTALDGWFDYDPTVHAVTPGDRTYLVRTAAGDYAKLRVWAWEDGVYTLSVRPVTRRVDVRELEVDASSRETWAYVSLRDGAVLDDVTDPMVDGRWDLAFSRTRVRTNGGTSGGGLGAAAPTEAADPIFVDAMPTEGFEVDVPRAEGPPGSPEVSSNPVLAAWFDYDPTTHTVTPRETVFAVRTADGNAALLAIRSYDAGRLLIEVAFAGPGRDTF